VFVNFRFEQLLAERSQPFERASLVLLYEAAVADNDRSQDSRKMAPRSFFDHLCAGFLLGSGLASMGAPMWCLPNLVSQPDHIKLPVEGWLNRLRTERIIFRASTASTPKDATKGVAGRRSQSRVG
jgi:hypothetical protein